MRPYVQLFSILAVAALVAPAALLNTPFIVSASGSGSDDGTSASSPASSASGGYVSENLAIYADWDHDQDGNGLDDAIDADLLAGLTGNLFLHVHYGRRPTAADASLLESDFGALRTYVFRNFDRIKVETSYDRVAGFRAAPDVLMVEKWVPPVMQMDVSKKVVRANSAAGFPVVGGIDHSLSVHDTLGLRGEGMVIAVLDTGVDDTHESLDDLDDDPATNDPKQLQKIDPVTGLPIFAAADASDGFVIRECVNVLDDMFHGTHVAGTAVGTGGPSGVNSGIAPRAHVVDVDINVPAATPFGFGIGLGEDLGMDWIISFNKGETCYGDPGADRIDVATMSFGAGGSSSTTSQSLSITAVARAGITMTVSAGNSGDAANTLTVGADGGIIVANHNDFNSVVRNDDKISATSSRGPRPSDGDADTLDEMRPDIAAPGENIMSAMFHTVDQYWSLSGTSMAAPHVAGVAALMLQANPTLRPVDKGASNKMGEVGAVPIRDVIQQTAQYKTATETAAAQQSGVGKFGLPWNNAWGYGAIDAYAAVRKAIDLGGGSLSVDAGGPYLGDPGVGITLTAAASGGIPPYTYAWTFGDGGTGSGASATHAYAAGTYTATVQVTDSSSPAKIAFDSATVAVGGSLPFAITFPGEGAALSGGVVTLEGTHTIGAGSTSGGVTFSDPAGDQTLTFVAATPVPVPLAFADVLSATMAEDGSDFVFTIEVDDLAPEAQANAHATYYFNFAGHSSACAVQGVAGSMSDYFVTASFRSSVADPTVFDARANYGGTCVVQGAGTRQSLGPLGVTVDGAADTVSWRAAKDFFDGATPFAADEAITTLNILAQGCLCLPSGSGAPVSGVTPTYDTASTTLPLIIGGTGGGSGTVEVSIDDATFAAPSLLAVTVDTESGTWEADWDVTGLTGAHRVYARQLDDAAAVVGADDVGVTLNGGGGEPFATITYPTNGATLAGGVTFTGTAGNGGVVDPDNELPTATIASNVNAGFAPLAVTFTVDGADTDGTIASWDLDFGDGSPHAGASADPAGAAVAHTYTTGGTYTARLCVNDNDGGQACATKDITVTTVLPPGDIVTLHLHGDTIVGNADRVSDTLALGVGSLTMTPTAPAAGAQPDLWVSSAAVDAAGGPGLHSRWVYDSPLDLDNAFLEVTFYAGGVNQALSGNFRVSLFVDADTSPALEAETSAGGIPVGPNEIKVTLGPITRSAVDSISLRIAGIFLVDEAAYAVWYDAPDSDSRVRVFTGGSSAIAFTPQAYNSIDGLGGVDTGVFVAGNTLWPAARNIELASSTGYVAHFVLRDSTGAVRHQSLDVPLEPELDNLGEAIDGMWQANGELYDIPSGSPNGDWTLSVTVTDRAFATQTREKTFLVRGTPTSPTSAPVFAGLESAVAGSRSVFLAWDAATSSTPVVYDVFLALSPAGVFANKIGDTTSSSYTVGMLTDGVTYHFGVRARNAAGEVDVNEVVVPRQPMSGGEDTPRVEVGVNGDFQTATGTTSWSHPFDTTSVANGPITVQARYFDGVSWSPTVSVSATVDNEAGNAPTIDILDPAEGSIVGGVVPVSGATGEGSGTDPNQAPTATLSSNVASGTAPLAVTFTAGGSDPDGDALTFSILYGDGQSAVLPGAGPVSHTYSAPGTYLAILTVSDGRGGADTAQLTIVASNVGDVLSLATGGAYFARGGETVILLATATGGASPYSFAWDLDDDGTFETAQGAGVPLSRAGSATGYPLAVRVTDAASQTLTASTTAWFWRTDTIPVSGSDVAGIPFALVSDPATLWGGDSYGYLQLKDPVAPGPNAHAFPVTVTSDVTTLSATIAWGVHDVEIPETGIFLNDYDLVWQTPSGLLVHGDAGTGSPSAYGASGEMPETSTMFDPEPGAWILYVQPFALAEPDAFTGAITVEHARDPRPTVTSTGFLAQNGVANALTATASGASGPFTFAWTLPDGSTASGATVTYTPSVTSGSGPGQLGSLKHSYVQQTATLTVTDAGGDSSTKLVPIYVRNIARDVEVVIAVIDTGAVPYHNDFAEAGLDLHPSVYLPGYPADTPALELCLDETIAACNSVTTAFNVDAAKWGAVTMGQLYWIPGTKMVGAISFGSDSGPNLIFDDQGHGSGTTSASTGNIWGSCPGCKLVSIEVDLSGAGTVPAMQWAADQEWIDIISISIGTLANAGVPYAGGIVGFEEDRASLKAVQAGKTIAIAAGNGALPFSGIDFGGGLVVNFPHGVPTFESNYVGPEWVVTVGAMSPRNGQDYDWHDYPVDVASYGDHWRTSFAGIPPVFPGAGGSAFSYVGDFGGTSCATPIVAGVMGSVLLEARRAMKDFATGVKTNAAGETGLAVAQAGASIPATGPLANGVLTHVELEDVVAKTAIPGDAISTNPNDYTLFLNADNTYPNHPAYFVREGFGLVNQMTGMGVSTRPASSPAGPPTNAPGHAGTTAKDVVLGLKPAPNRFVVEQWMSAVDTVRDAIWAPNPLVADTDGDDDAYPIASPPAAASGGPDSTVPVPSLLVTRATEGSQPSSAGAVLYLHNTPGSGFFLNTLSRVDGDVTGQGGTGVGPTSFTFPMGNPSLAGPLAFDTTQTTTIVLGVSTITALAPAYPDVPITATLEGSNGKVIASGTVSRPMGAAISGNRYVFSLATQQASFDPAVDGDLRLRVTATFPANVRSIHFETEGKTFVALPLVGAQNLIFPNPAATSLYLHKARDAANACPTGVTWLDATPRDDTGTGCGYNPVGSAFAVVDSTSSTAIGEQARTVVDLFEAGPADLQYPLKVMTGTATAHIFARSQTGNQLTLTVAVYAGADLVGKATHTATLAPLGAYQDLAFPIAITKSAVVDGADRRLSVQVWPESGTGDWFYSHSGAARSRIDGIVLAPGIIGAAAPVVTVTASPAAGPAPLSSAVTVRVTDADSATLQSLSIDLDDGNAILALTNVALPFEQTFARSYALGAHEIVVVAVDSSGQPGSGAATVLATPPVSVSDATFYFHNSGPTTACGSGVTTLDRQDTADGGHGCGYNALGAAAVTLEGVIGGPPPLLGSIADDFPYAGLEPFTLGAGTLRATVYVTSDTGNALTLELSAFHGTTLLGTSSASRTLNPVSPYVAFTFAIPIGESRLVDPADGSTNLVLRLRPTQSTGDMFYGYDGAETSTAVMPVVVTPPDLPPIADLTSDVAAILAGEGVEFSLDATDDHGIYAWSLDLGDGTTVSSGDYGVLPQVIQHTYTAVGTITATLTVEDTIGQTDTDSVQITVSAQPDLPPMASLSAAATADAGETVTFTLSAADDVGIASWTLAFGDGESTSGAGAPPATLAHAYARPGPVSAAFLVTDTAAQSATATRGLGIVGVQARIGTSEYAAATDTSAAGDWSAWTVDVDAASQAAGPTTIAARYYDGDAWADSSIAVTIRAPASRAVVTITSPADGALVNGVVPIEGTGATEDVPASAGSGGTGPDFSWWLLDTRAETTLLATDSTGNPSEQGELWAPFNQITSREAVPAQVRNAATQAGRAALASWHLATAGPHAQGNDHYYVGNDLRLTYDSLQQSNLQFPNGGTLLVPAADPSGGRVTGVFVEFAIRGQGEELGADVFDCLDVQYRIGSAGSFASALSSNANACSTSKISELIPAWETRTVSLPVVPASGAQAFQMRFRFTSDETFENEGYHIDAVRIYYTYEEAGPEVSNFRVSPPIGFVDQPKMAFVDYCHAAGQEPDRIEGIVDAGLPTEQRFALTATSSSDLTCPNVRTFSALVPALPVGLYVAGAEAETDGTVVTSNPMPVRILNRAPTLSSLSASPALATTDTDVVFRATYRDQDGHAASSVSAIVDGEAFPATLVSGSPATGAVYEHVTKLAQGSHSFAFEADDGFDTVTTSAQNGPTVVSGTAQPPTLTDGRVTPTSAAVGTTFTWTVRYADANGDAPAYVEAVVDGIPRAMTCAAGDVLAGVDCTYATSDLSLGAHSFYFRAEDAATHQTRAPTSGVVSGPTVTDFVSLVEVSLGNGEWAPASLVGGSYASWVYNLDTGGFPHGRIDVLARGANSDGEVGPTTAISLIVNRAPTAALMASATETLTLNSVTFDATGSADDDLANAQYRFTFGDGSPAVTQSSPLIAHSFSRGEHEGAAYTVSVVVIDSDGVQSAPASVVVTVFNRAPQLDPLPQQVVVDGAHLEFDVTASDPEGEDLSLVASGLPAGATFTDHGDGTGTLSWTPSVLQSGEHSFQVVASDGEDTDAETYSILVVDTNLPPVPAFTLTPAAASSRTDVTFTDQSTDPNGVIASRAWVLRLIEDATPDGVADTPGVVFSSTAASATFRVPDDGTYEVALTVTDDEGVSATLVKPLSGLNIAPAVSSSGPAYVRVGAPATFRDFSSDVDGAIAQRLWDLDGDGIFELSTTATTFTHAFPTQGTVVVSHRVVDTDGASATRSLTVLVDGTPPVTVVTAPTLPAGGWYATSPVRLTVTRSDTGGSGFESTTVTVDGVGTPRGGTGTFTVDVAGEGIHTLTYSSRDRAGNVEAVRTLLVRIDTQAPTVRLTSPSAASSPGPALHGGVHTVGTVIPLAAEAADAASGVAQVEFFVDGESIGVDTDGNDGWTAVWDTAGRNTGSYEVEAVAHDVAGFSARSAEAVVLLLVPPPAGVDANAGFSASNDCDLAIGAACAGGDDVAVSGDSTGAAAFEDELAPFGVTQGASAAAGLASDAGEGGELEAGAGAFAADRGCSVEASLAAGPGGDCGSVADATATIQFVGENDCAIVLPTACAGSDSVTLRFGPGLASMPDGPAPFGILQALGAWIGFLGDGASGNGGGVAVSLDAGDAGCSVATFGGPVNPAVAPAMACALA